MNKEQLKVGDYIQSTIGTFAIRFKQFLEWVPVNWITSQPHYIEEFEFMDKVADYLLNYQIQTAVDEEEINYLKRLKLL